MNFETRENKTDNQTEFPGISEAILVDEKQLLSKLNLPSISSSGDFIKLRAESFGLNPDSSVEDIDNWAKQKIKIFLGLPEDATEKDVVYTASERKADLLNLPLDASSAEVARALEERAVERDEEDSRYIIGDEAGIRSSSKINQFIEWYFRNLSEKKQDETMTVTDAMKHRAVELGLPAESSNQDVIDILRNPGSEIASAFKEGRSPTKKDMSDVMDSFNKVESCRRYELPLDASWEEIAKSIAEDILFSNGSKIRDNWSDDDFIKEVINAIEKEKKLKTS